MAKQIDEKNAVPKGAIFWLVVTTMLWGGSFVFNKIGFREIHPINFLFFRFTIATVIMGLICIGRYSLLGRALLTKGIVVGFALAAANLTFVLGVNETSVSRAGFLNNLFVLFVPLICLALWKEKVSRVTLTGLSFAVAGLLLLAHGGAEGFNRGDLLSTVCAFFIALQIVAVTILRNEDVFLVTFVQFASVTLISGVITLFFAPPTHSFGMVSVGALLYCAVFPTVICFTLQNTYQRFTTPAQAGLIYTLDPIWSMLGGFLLLGERLSVIEWTGCTLIFIGVVLPIGISRLTERKYLHSDAAESGGAQLLT